MGTSTSGLTTDGVANADGAPVTGTPASEHGQSLIRRLLWQAPLMGVLVVLLYFLFDRLADRPRYPARYQTKDAG